ncbi:putative IQ motif, EF-hand binding, leucine-rich repeat domain superfamily [Plasmopara halstedii]
MESFDLSRQNIVQLKQIPEDIRRQIEDGNDAEYALDLSVNRLHRIDEIGVFEHVSQLDLSENQLDNLNGLQILRCLKSVDLSRNCVTSIEMLASLPALQILKVAENSLTTINSLRLFPGLRVVDASYNRITKWPLLAGLHLLESLDLSDNLLGSLTPSNSGSLFPANLRRLSIARNQIHQICGIACLGLHLKSLVFLDFHENPVVLEIERSGGQLERLFAAFFPKLHQSSDGGLIMSRQRHEKLALHPHFSSELMRTVLEGHEEPLIKYLVTGRLISYNKSTDSSGEILSFQCEDRPLSERNQQKSSSSNTLEDQCNYSFFPDSTLTVWKPIQGERKTQLCGFTSARSVLGKEKMVRWGEESVLPMNSQNGTRTPALTTKDLDGSEYSSPVVPACSLSSTTPSRSSNLASTEPLNSSSLRGDESDVVRKLAHQVNTMRKYMKIWIKREKMVRNASARKIQRWIRRVKTKFELQQRILHSRSRRKDKYSFHHCISISIPSSASENDSRAQIIQGHARGFIIRRRTARFKQQHRAACKIQRFWRIILSELFPDDQIRRLHRSRVSKKRLLCERYCRTHRGMIQCSRDVRQLQQVCAVQEKAISCLWGHRICSKVTEKNVLCCDESKQSANFNKIFEMQCQIDRQTIEIDQLKSQVETLRNLVIALADSRKQEKV